MHDHAARTISITYDAAAVAQVLLDAAQPDSVTGRRDEGFYADGCELLDAAMGLINDR